MYFICPITTFTKHKTERKYWGRYKHEAAWYVEKRRISSINTLSVNSITDCFNIKQRAEEEEEEEVNF